MAFEQLMAEAAVKKGKDEKKDDKKDDKKEPKKEEKKEAKKATSTTHHHSPFAHREKAEAPLA